MLFPTLIAGGFSLIMASAPEAVAEQVAKAQESQRVAVVAEARVQKNVFPTEAMAE